MLPSLDLQGKKVQRESKLRVKSPGKKKDPKGNFFLLLACELRSAYDLCLSGRRRRRRTRKKKSYEILITCIDFGNLSYGFHGKERAYQLIEIMIQL